MNTYVGLDLSLTSTGVVVIDPFSITCWTVKSAGKKTDSWDQRRSRIVTAADRILSRVPAESHVCVEAPSYGSPSSAGHQHDRSGLWWFVMQGLHGLDCHVTPVVPSILKKYATGKGNAGKDAVLAAVVKRYPDVPVTGNDVADALVLAAIAARLHNHPIDKLPGTHLAALQTLM